MAALDFIPDHPVELRDATVKMAACINHADWRFIKLIAAMERTRAWRHGGFCSLVNWLDYHCGLGAVASRERIRTGRKLATLRKIDQAFRDNELSYSKVRAITRVATVRTEELWLSMARSSSANEIERLVRTYERTPESATREADEGACHRARALDWHYDNGMLIINAALPADAGAMLVQALERVIDGKALEREAYWEARCAGSVPHDQIPEVTQDYGVGEAGSEFEMSDERQRRADAVVDLAEHYLASDQAPLRRPPNKRYEVLLTIDRNELAATSENSEPRFTVNRDWGVDAPAARQIACDADITELVIDRNGGIDNFERRRRIVPPEMSRAVEVRDGKCCRFPGCSHSRYLENHHIIHWIDGGKTKIDNIIKLCSTHHRLHHHDAYFIKMVDGEVTFLTRDGEIMDEVLNPQFQDVSAEALPIPVNEDCCSDDANVSSETTACDHGDGHASEKWPARKPIRYPREAISPPTGRSVSEKLDDRAIAGMVYHRDLWGRGEAARFWRWFQRDMRREDASEKRSGDSPTG